MNDGRQILGPVAVGPHHRGGGVPCSRRLGPRVALDGGGYGSGCAVDIFGHGLCPNVALLGDGRRLVDFRDRLPDGAESSWDRELYFDALFFLDRGEENE